MLGPLRTRSRSSVHREGTKNAKIIYVSLRLRALRVFAVHHLGG
jgi:hypothetical protein